MEGVQYATGEEQRASLIAPERMKQLGQSKGNPQVAVSPVKVESVWCRD